MLGGAPQEILRGAVTVDRDDMRVIELRRGLGRSVEVILRRTDLGAWQDLHGQHPLVRVTGQVHDRAGWPLEQAVDPELGRQLAPRVQLTRLGCGCFLDGHGRAGVAAQPAGSGGVGQLAQGAAGAAHQGPVTLKGALWAPVSGELLTTRV